MFNWNKPQKPPRAAKKDLSAYGLFDIPDNFDGNDSLENEEDSDLEAELAKITAGSAPRPKPRKPKVVPSDHLASMVAESLKDIPSDEELSGDDDDPDLLNELADLTGDNMVEEPEEKPASPPPVSVNMVDLLSERLKMYSLAEENAKKVGETSRARRFNRGVKTLKDLLKQAQAGKPIDETEIPPVVSVTVHTSKPDVVPQVEPTPEEKPDSTPEPVPDKTEPKDEEITENTEPKPEVDSKLLEMLNQRKMEYKNAALQAKKINDNQTAISYIKIVKQFQLVIEAVEKGQPVDLSKMPGPPGSFQSTQPQPSKEESEIQKSSEPPEIPAASEDRSQNEEGEGEAEALEEPTLITAGSILEALEQRLQKYQSEEQKAKEEGNNSKARRMGRITKQFEQAIKLHKSGKPVPFDELPTPPGYAPIPIPEEAKPKPPPPKPPAPKPPVASPPTVPTSQEDTNKPDPGSIRKSGNQSSTTLNEKQLNMLLAKQKEFKLAALNAKKKGELNEAKEFLRTAKGFDPLIEAARCGLPVDMATLPIPVAARTQLEDGFDYIVAAECVEDDSGVIDILVRLEEQLTKQLKMCMSTRDHHKALGDVAGMNRFEQLGLTVTKELDIIRIAKRSGDNVVPPKFHYETRNFSIVQCCTDLNDDELELSIVRGINYRCSNPNEIDTYVKFEFPFPQEEPWRDKTGLIKNTNNPEYGSTFKIPIQRNSRPCQRVFKRHGIKLEVWSKGGFFRGDTLLGTVTVKLQPLETKCVLHESFDILDGRKPLGGKLEIKVRIRNPILTRQVEEVSEKWLVIDS